MIFHVQTTYHAKIALWCPIMFSLQYLCNIFKITSIIHIVQIKTYFILKIFFLCRYILLLNYDIYTSFHPCTSQEKPGWCASLLTLLAIPVRGSSLDIKIKTISALNELKMYSGRRHNIGIQMKQKELPDTSMMISKWKKSLVPLIFTNLQPIPR